MWLINDQLMKFLLSTITFISVFSSVFSQGEEIGPLTFNSSLNAANSVNILKSGSTFDSTFI